MQRSDTYSTEMFVSSMLKIAKNFLKQFIFDFNKTGFYPQAGITTNNFTVLKRGCDVCYII
jgi:hypothetical protein